MYFFSGSVQSKGACIVPKRGLDVMNGEVNRVLQLTSNAIIPITYQVPRKVSQNQDYCIFNIFKVFWTILNLFMKFKVFDLFSD